MDHENRRPRHGVSPAIWIGDALSDVTLGWFDWQAKAYREIPLDEQVEVLTLAGDVAPQDDQLSKPRLTFTGRPKRDPSGCTSVSRRTSESVVTLLLS